MFLLTTKATVSSSKTNKLKLLQSAPLAAAGAAVVVFAGGLGGPLQKGVPQKETAKLVSPLLLF